VIPPRGRLRLLCRTADARLQARPGWLLHASALRDQQLQLSKEPAVAVEAFDRPVG
jgi:hypothetical protein